MSSIHQNSRSVRKEFLGADPVGHGKEASRRSWFGKFAAALAVRWVGNVRRDNHASLAHGSEPDVGLERGRGQDLATHLPELVDGLVMRHDAEGLVLDMNDQSRRLFEIAPDDLRGTGLFHRIHVADRPAFLQALSTARRGASPTVVTFRMRSGIVTKGAQGIDEPNFAWAEMRIRGVNATKAEGADAATTFLSVTRNVTESKENERRLDFARAEADLAISLKDRLLANVSHELRTPLNAILGFSEILGNPELTPSEPAKQLEYARIIHASAEHLLSVVNLVLDMSKIEAGKFEITPEPFDIGALIKDCCDMVRLRAESGKVRLLVDLSDVPVDLTADKRACRQILLNLVSNAVKFTPPDGAVTIQTELVDNSVHIVITDTGIGIAAEDLPRLGNPFFQVRSNYDRSFEGAGLGLSLVRGLVGLHGGALLLASAPKVGTRVTVRLPVDCRSAPGVGVGAPRLETEVLTVLEPRSVAKETDEFHTREERKIA